MALAMLAGVPPPRAAGSNVEPSRSGYPPLANDGLSLGDEAIGDGDGGGGAAGGGGGSRVIRASGAPESGERV